MRYLFSLKGHGKCAKHAAFLVEKTFLNLRTNFGPAVKSRVPRKHAGFPILFSPQRFWFKF